jgi:hypothetical protein
MKEAPPRLTEGNVIGSKKPFLPPIPLLSEPEVEALMDKPSLPP